MILVRYSEIGLKSTPVRVRFENRLRDNMISMLARDGVEAMISKKDARFFVETSDVEKAVKALRRVFGIASISVTVPCSSDMEDICGTAAEYSKGRIQEGQSFAVKARREGIHRFTSVDVGREAGSAIFNANENIKVDLTHPDVVFNIEVRNNKAYIFDSYTPCHGGLPVGTQGRVFAEVDDDRGTLSAWLMMKRGCKVYAGGSAGDILEYYDPDIKFIADISECPKEILGVVKGTSFAEFESIDVEMYNVPLYFPTIGMADEEVSAIMKNIKEEIDL